MDIQADNYTEEYYKLHRRRYLLRDAWAQKRNTDILSLLRPRPGETILDVGCGIGMISLESFMRGASVTGIDYSDIAIKIARELELAVLGTHDIEFRCMDVRDISTLARQFDKVVCADFIEHVSKDLFEVLLLNIKGIMKREGILVLYTPSGFMQPTALQKVVRLIGLLPAFHYDYRKNAEKRFSAQWWYSPGKSEAVPDDKYEFLHVDVKTAPYVCSALKENGFRIQRIRITRSSSRLRKLPYPYNILWGGHIGVIAQVV